MLKRILIAAACMIGCGSERVVIESDDGPLRGESDGDTMAFLGVPYAEPPTGELRFAPPRRVAAREEVREANAAAPSCPQLQMGTTKLAADTSEDCLYLNIWAPERSGSFPVMVWIPGGGYVIGHGAQREFNGEHLSQQRDVVVVTINYRLGAFGFLSHEALRSEEGNTGNWGLLDQREALRWVKRNIAAFHGDPERVTLFGESAGGGSTCIHMLSPGSTGLFRRAIIESAPCTAFDMPTREQSEAQGADLADALDCSGADAEIVRCLRDAPMADVLRALPPNEHFIYGDGVAWYPSVDGVVLEDQPARLLERGASADVSVIVGANSHEGEIFFAGDEFPDDDKVNDVAVEIFGEPLAQEALEHYAEGGPRKERITRMVSDAMICDARRIARLHTAAGGVAFHYHFTQAPYDRLLKLGAFHTAEIGYVFGNGLAIKLPPAAIPLKNAIQGYWSGLARSGDPNNGKRPRWNRYDLDHDNSIRLDLAVSKTHGVRRDACEFWDRLRSP